MTDIQEELDHLSLEQAIRDLDIANARVMDLTQRLITVTNQLAVSQREAEELRLWNERFRRNRVFKLAHRVRSVLQAVR